MKKVMLVSIIALFANLAFSQEGIKGMKLGARVGYQMQSASESELDMGMLGFGAGVKASIPIAAVANLSFNPELSFLYRQLFTSSYEDEYDDIKIDQDMTEFAISVPLMLQYQIINKLYLAAGLQLDIPFSTEMYEEDGDGNNRTTDMGDERATIDFALPLGAGYFINENLSIDLRLIIGLTDFGDDVDFSFNQYGLGVTYFFE